MHDTVTLQFVPGTCVFGASKVNWQNGQVEAISELSTLVHHLLSVFNSCSKHDKVKK